MTMRTLIAGFGNVLLSDDGFGVEVVKRLAGSALPAHVETMDVGIGGMDLVLRLMEGFEAIIVVDAVSRGESPGTLYCFAPDAADIHLGAGERIYPHFAEPTRSMKLASVLGYLPDNVTVVGCEPASCELGMSLTHAVDTAADRAVETICKMVGYAG
ncbi:hydrogenase maturation protease [Candidatus Entotheonella palauensis]|uniref:Hydrogenase maturation protease n=1 Tax=Candidatus Entotheonella gemina TaxID=1429439 RepID=W4MD09_9BACT|nr:hydrogenase maturation protease [Candidatus Entotheonella palauensis]ETX07517.1 MAG: hypothetical protein ETSY2_10765 [Candidatus Entotheonella gemina]